ncbi:MAG TPA: ligase-associated DNA damage response endonuclease PdeM [Cyclobacteriaceae bacterium]
MMEADVFGELLELHPQKAAFWPKHKILMVADLHLGKINHFRKAGIAVPTRANDKNIEVLVDLFWKTKPERVLFLGDLFHSHYNPEWEVFGEVVKHFESISFELVLGNHDIMSERQYERKGIRFYDELQIGPFLFTHHPVEKELTDLYNLAGHIHPGVRLVGKGKQQLRLPCFYFGKSSGLLPAFGMFTGLASIKSQKDDKIFVVAENKIHLITDNY